MQNIFEKNCPVKKHRVCNDSYPLWETSIIQKLRRAKDRAYRDGKPSFIYLRNTLDMFIKKAKQSYFDRKVNSLKAGTASWWRSIKAIEKGTNTRSPSNYLIDDKLCSSQMFVNKQSEYYSGLAEPLQDPPTPAKIKDYKPDEISIGQVKRYLRQIQWLKLSVTFVTPWWFN